MKTLFVIFILNFLLAASFASAGFFNWAWDIGSHGGEIYPVRPVAAIVGLMLLCVGVALTFGPLLAIPMRNLGFFK